MNESLKIIENGVVVTCDPQDRLGQLTMLIKGDRIAEISNRAEVLKALYPAAEVIDARGKIVLPGFVDAHLHGESFVLRLFTSLKPYARWRRETDVKKAFDFVYGHADQPDLASIYRLAYFTALKSGVTTIGEFGFDHLDRPLNAAFETMRRADVRGVIGVHNGDQIERCRTLPHQSIRFALAVPPEEEVTTYHLQSTLRAAARLKWPLLVHAGETKKGREGFKKNFQKSFLEILRDHHFFEGKIILLHCASLEATDWEVLENARATVVLTPRSAILKETEAPRIAEFIGRQIPIVLASDWGLSDPFEVLRSYAILARGQNVEVPRGAGLVRLMTINAARALGFDDQVGSLEAGKKADVTFLDVSGARFAGIRGKELKSLLASVLLESSSRDVSDVLINGEFFVRQGQVLTYSKEDLVHEGEQLMDKISRFVSTSATPVGEKRSDARSIADRPEAERAKLQNVDDGVRLIQKERPAVGVEKKIIPLQIDPAKNVKLPERVKKIFGDEET